MSTHLQDLVYTCLVENPEVPPATAAKRMKMRYAEFMQIVDPYDTKHELTLDFLYAYMQVTNDIRILDYVVNSLGYRLVEDPSAAEAIFEAKVPLESSIPVTVSPRPRYYCQ